MMADSRLSRVQELVADPMSESRWTSVVHISVMLESLWNSSQDVRKAGPFMYWMQSRSNDYRMRVHGYCSNQDGLQTL